MDELHKWEERFRAALAGVPADRRARPGALLAVVPSRNDWDDFLADVRAAWPSWRSNLQQHPTSLALLYAGIAFFHYDDRTFWLHFSNLVSGAAQPPNTTEQTTINSAFWKAAETLGLGMLPSEHRKDSVGTAVYQVGIPLSLWDSFLEICEWAIWRDDWKSLPDAEWAAAVARLVGSKRRLQKVLIENRASAAAFMQELLEARQILSTDHTLTVEQLAHATILRTEYFDAVPETADFLRPKDPESLFQDRPKLVWNDRKSCFSLYLPAIPDKQLPATWTIGGLSKTAASGPDEVRLDSGAFNSALTVHLHANGQTARQIVRGVQEWGLFDLELGGRQVNTLREELPLRSYALLARSPVEFETLEGFVTADNPQNESVTLADGGICYVTRLWPNGKYAELAIKGLTGTTVFRFKPRARLESRFFVGRGYRSAFFQRLSDGRIKTDSLPELCAVIPRGYFRDNFAELRRRFRVFEGGHAAGGEWIAKGTSPSDDRELYVWKWSSKPFIEARPNVSNLKHLEDLRVAFRGRDMSGRRTFRFGAADLPTTYEIDLIYPVKEIQQRWSRLPGSYLPWFLLCQDPKGMTWEDMLLARDAIAPDINFSPHLLRRYAKLGLLAQHGQRWVMLQSRAVSTLAVKNRFQLQYCGDPSIVWSLYMAMHRELGAQELPDIVPSDERAGGPYLAMEWPVRVRSAIQEFLRERRVAIVKDLWTH